ncbi:MAG: hypothetical protein ACTHMF_01520 [Leifsonia sp.]|uniref:hypothetical protein n=1 Tax=Leifsonia sp. TaxID=1870902 RepID=UPI003F7D4234
MDRIPDDGVDAPELGDADAGDTAGWTDTDDGDVDYAADDPIAEADFADELVTNDAVAGDTVWGNDPGAEAQPKYDEHDPQDDPDDGILTEEDVEEEGI